MMRLDDKKIEIIKYLFFGALTVFINIFAYGILTDFLGCSLVVSNTLAWVFAVIFAFITNKLYVFNSKNENTKELLKEASSFFIFRLISYFIDMGLMFALVAKIGVNDIVAKVVINVIVIIFNYVASKVFIFKKKTD